MGITYVDGVARGPTGKEEAVTFLVDSGATYSLLPNSVWESIGLVPKRAQAFALADGTSPSLLYRPAVSISLDAAGEAVQGLVFPVETGIQRAPWFPASAGKTNARSRYITALLGVVTLEILGLMFNPFNRTPHPMRMLLV